MFELSARKHAAAALIPISAVENAILCPVSLKSDRMTKTLLLDLDNTLLINDTNTFIPSYLQVLANRLSPFADPKLIAKTLISAVSSMMQNQQPDLTLMDVFDASFYPVLGLTKENVQPAVDCFYAEDFPKLIRLTSPRPEAVSLVTQAQEMGYQIGIATAPLFPLTAIQQRLGWAGLPVDRYHFSLVPSYNSFHFAKPNPAYYAEFLAQLGWPDGPVIMVGDEADLDILGARQLGIASFWTPSLPGAAWPSSDPEPPQGGLADVLAWIESASVEISKRNFNSPQAILAIMRSTPAALQTLCRSLDGMNWSARPQENEWSLTEVLCHLRDVETEVFLPRFEKIIEEDNPFIIGIETDPWAEERQYIQQNGPQALVDFINSRKKLLSLLTPLPAEVWQRPARHAIFGPTHLQELASFISEHDRLHIQQINQHLKLEPHPPRA
jgi:FMN phosphatase YigB (HAD superfamily)